MSRRPSVSLAACRRCASAGGAREGHEIEVAGLFETHALAACERVAARHHQHQAVFTVVHDVQAQRGRAVGKDADVGAAVEHGQHDLAAVLLFELDADARIGRHEAREFARQELRHGRGVDPQAHHAHHARGVIGQVGRELVDVVQDALRMPVQRIARNGERDAARMTLEEFGAHCGFEIGDALARRAHRQVREFSALADAAGAHHEVEKRERDEVEAVQVHGAARAGRKEWPRLCAPARAVTVIT
ncbi:hypothetical protein J2W28_003369 [Variovorax boronicumulans]|nr:hypothetical protein [Variovorax boronicumulans]MDQ0004218.1 hypothetical protein [Variovorax boronicumulans]